MDFPSFAFSAFPDLFSPPNSQQNSQQNSQSEAANNQSNGEINEIVDSNNENSNSSTSLEPSATSNPRKRRSSVAEPVDFYISTIVDSAHSLMSSSLSGEFVEKCLKIIGVSGLKHVKNALKTRIEEKLSEFETKKKNPKI